MRVSKKHQNRDVPELLNETLPQSFTGHDEQQEPLAANNLNTNQKEEIKSLIRELAIERCKRFKIDDDLYESNLGPEAAALAKEWGAVGGFELCDNRRLEALERNRISLVSVLFIPLPGDKSELVPLVHAHEHPDNLGEQIREAVDTHYSNSHGLSPRKLLLRARQEQEQRWRKTRNTIIGVGVAGASIGGGVVYGPSIVKNVSQTVESYQQQREAAQLREHQIRLLQVDKVIETLKTEPITRRGILESLSKEHYQSIYSELESENLPKRAKALDSLLYLSKQELISQAEEGNRFGNDRGFQESRMVDHFLSVIQNDNDSSMRSNAAEAIHSMRQFVINEIEAQN